MANKILSTTIYISCIIHSLNDATARLFLIFHLVGLLNHYQSLTFFVVLDRVIVTIYTFIDFYFIGLNYFVILAIVLYFISKKTHRYRNLLHASAHIIVALTHYLCY